MARDNSAILYYLDSLVSQAYITPHWETIPELMEKSSTSDCQSSVSLGLSVGLQTPERVDSPSFSTSYHNLSRDLEKMYNDETSDVVMIPDGISPKDGVRVHSFILMARTGKYWREKMHLLRDTRKSLPLVISLGDKCSLTALRRVTQYLYTGEVSSGMVERATVWAGYVVLKG